MQIPYRAAGALLLACGLLCAQALPQLTCAGGTFPDPIYQKWIAAFNAQRPGLPITYRAVGSDEAIEEFKDHRVDFAASDFPPDERMQTDLGIHLIPSLVGAAVPVYNLPNFDSDLRFTPDVLADIYLGRITMWNDPRIKALNRKTPLPRERIVVVHRSDGSGTTYLWTQFLASASSQWRDRVGASVTPAWPTGQGENGNEGVAAFVSKTPFSIGYVEFIYALQSRLNFGSVQNPAGAFVRAGIDTIKAAASTAAPEGSGRISIVNAAGRNAYPICSSHGF